MPATLAAATTQNRRWESGRLAMARLADKEIVQKLFDEIAPRYTERNGGYTRVLKLGKRPTDNADMVIIELVE